MIYGSNTLNDLGDVVETTIGNLKPHVKKFDSIVVRGVSGLLVGPSVSLALNKPLVVVRKPSEKTHSFRAIINYRNIGMRYLFLDDLTESGATREACCNAIANQQAGIPPTKLALHVADYYYASYNSDNNIFKPTHKRRPKESRFI